jgi:hypothetical protein
MTLIGRLAALVASPSRWARLSVVTASRQSRLIEVQPR